MNKKGALTGYRSTESGNEYKIMQPHDGFWAVFKRVNYPSGELHFWQQISRPYRHRIWAVKYMTRKCE